MARRRHKRDDRQGREGSSELMSTHLTYFLSDIKTSQTYCPSSNAIFELLDDLKADFKPFTKGAMQYLL